MKKKTIKKEKNKDKNLSVKEYLYKIMSYLHDMIHGHKGPMKAKVSPGNKVIRYKNLGEWKIQLTMQVNFISCKDTKETRIMHIWSDNVETVMGNEAYGIIN